MLCTQLLILVLLTIGLTSSLDTDQTVDNDSFNETPLEKFQFQPDFTQGFRNRIELVTKSLEQLPKAANESTFTLFTDSKKNWFEAFADCRKRGLFLASIQNQEELVNILEQINALEDTENGNFWVSATDLAQDNKFVWMSSGDDVSYAEWCPFEPNNLVHYNIDESENCMELRYNCDYGMNDEMCSSQNYYICEDRSSDLSAPTSSELSPEKTKEFTVVNRKKLSWYGALADCKRQGLRLATIDSVEEQQEVVDLIKAAVGRVGYETNFWLSGSDLGKEGEYVWMTTGQPLNYTAWNNGNGIASHTRQPDHYQGPDGRVEHCLSVRGIDHTWNDLVCSRKFYYICDNQK